MAPKMALRKKIGFTNETTPHDVQLAAKKPIYVIENGRA